MPTELPRNAPTLLIRRDAYERLGFTRSAIDERLGLTADEFRVADGLVVIGPVYDADALERLVIDLEAAGLQHFDDYFDLSGNWPAWLRITVASEDAGSR